MKHINYVHFNIVKTLLYTCELNKYGYWFWVTISIINAEQSRISSERAQTNKAEWAYVKGVYARLEKAWERNVGSAESVESARSNEGGYVIGWRRRTARNMNSRNLDSEENNVIQNRRHVRKSEIRTEEERAEIVERTEKSKGEGFNWRRKRIRAGGTRPRRGETPKTSGTVVPKYATCSLSGYGSGFVCMGVPQWSWVEFSNQVVVARILLEQRLTKR